MLDDVPWDAAHARRVDRHRYRLRAVAPATLVFGLVHLANALMPAECCGQAPSLRTRVTPSAFSGSGRVTLVVQVDSEIPLPDSVQIRPELTPSDAFVVEPNSVPIPAGERHIAATFSIRAVAPDSGAHDGVVVVHVERVADSGPREVATSELGFSFRPEITAGCYLGLALMGLLLGWAIKRLIKYMAGVPDPADLPADRLAELLSARARRTTGDRVREFVARWFDLFDLLLTAVIGGAVIVGLMDDGATPPAVAASWPHALILGVALGTLGNTELLTRLRSR